MAEVVRRAGEVLRRLEWLSPAAAAAAVIAVTDRVYAFTIHAYLPDCCQAITSLPALPANQPSSFAALLWAISAVVFIAVSLVAIAVMAGVTYRSSAEYSPRRPWNGIALASAVSLAIWLAAAAWGSLLGGEYAASAVFRQVLSDDVVSFITFLWALTALAAVLVVAGACACLLESGETRGLASAFPNRESAEGVRRRAELLHRRARRLQAVLFAGAAVLVAGVLELDALYGWATAFLPPDLLPPEQGKLIARAATVPTGTFFSLFLASAYLPAALILRRNAQHLAKRALPDSGEPERTKWLQDHALGITLTTQLSSFVALLGPMIAGGPFAALGNLFG